jgi:hypothetical protein
MKVIQDYFFRLFFKPVDSFNLGLTRIIYCLLLFAVYSFSHFNGREWLLNNDYYNKDVYYHLYPILGIKLHTWLQYILGIALFTGTIGLKTRSSLIIACITYLLYEYPISSVFRPYTNNIAFFSLLILASAPGVDRFSVDQWILRNKKEFNKTSQPWPQRAAMLTIGMIYLNAFVSKIVNSGWGWAFDGNFQGYHLNRLTLRENVFAEWIVTSPDWVGNSIALFAAVVEALFVLSVFLPMKLSWIFLVLGVGMHFAILITMKINFFIIFGFTYLFLINWKSLLSYLPNPIKVSNEKI